MARALVTATRHRWQTGVDDDGYAIVHEAFHGDTIDVSQDELARGVALCVLEPVDGRGKAGTPAAEKKVVDKMTGKQLDAYAAELGIADWDEKAKVPEKKAAVKRHLSAPPAPEPVDFDALDDDALRAAAAASGVDDADTADRETLLAALREKQTSSQG